MRSRKQQPQQHQQHMRSPLSYLHHSHIPHPLLPHSSPLSSCGEEGGKGEGARAERARTLPPVPHADRGAARHGRLDLPADRPRPARKGGGGGAPRGDDGRGRRERDVAPALAGLARAPRSAAVRAATRARGARRRRRSLVVRQAASRRDEASEGPAVDRFVSRTGPPPRRKTSLFREIR